MGSSKEVVVRLGAAVQVSQAASARAGGRERKRACAKLVPKAVHEHVHEHRPFMNSSFMFMFTKSSESRDSQRRTSAPQFWEEHVFFVTGL